MAEGPVLVSGASGFVGRQVCERLLREGRSFIAAGRRPEMLSQRFAGMPARYLDVHVPESIDSALLGCDAAVYLVHGMAQGGDYETREARAAENFVRAAERAGVKRIVYLGGPQPKGELSRHLRSRLRTGEILRGGSVATVELQASMIVGDGSESFQIVRDLAARLPLMVLPRWLESRSEPIAIDDVTFAISRCLSMPLSGNEVLPLPGPEALSGRQVLEQTARIFGVRPLIIGVPFVTPTLSSYWIRWVTSAQRQIAEELVQGLREDLLAANAGFWLRYPEHERLPYAVAAASALTGSGLVASGQSAIHGPFRRLLALLIGRFVREAEALPVDAPAHPEAPHDK